MKNKFSKSSAVAIVVVALLSIGFFLACNNDIDQNISKESTSKEELRKTAMSIIDINTINFDSIVCNIHPYEELYNYMDIYHTSFSHAAYIAYGMNEDDEIMVDFYIIPFESQLAINEFNPIFLNNAKVEIYSTKDKNQFYNWVDGQIKDGKIVVTYYDEKTGTYGAMSYTKWEWALFMR